MGTARLELGAAGHSYLVPRFVAPCLTTPRETLNHQLFPRPRCYRTTHEFATWSPVEALTVHFCASPLRYLFAPSVRTRHKRNNWSPTGPHDMPDAGACQQAATQVQSVVHLISKGSSYWVACSKTPSGDGISPPAIVGSAAAGFST